VLFRWPVLNDSSYIVYIGYIIDYWNIQGIFNIFYKSILLIANVILLKNTYILNILLEFSLCIFVSKLQFKTAEKTRACDVEFFVIENLVK